MRSTQGQRRRLPTEEGIDLALQFGELLDYAHQRNIVFLDHKLEHIYWDGHTLRVIDWNSSKLFDSPAALDSATTKDIHNMCVGVLYPVFTGMAAQRGQLRPQPGNRSEVEKRYADITELDFGAEPSLSGSIRDLLNRGAQQEIATAEAFLKLMSRVALRFGWNIESRQSDPQLQAARDNIREGLVKLRMSEDLAREAQELFLNAATMDDINEDIEQELRRLMKGINDFISARIIP